MGVYLSSPITEKESIDEACPDFTYGASSMQGWRINQEDAHNCIPDFDPKTKTSFFAVYDGHGGPEVAKYCERHFPEFVKLLIKSQDENTDPEKIIKGAFLAFDATLTQEEVIKELKVLSGKEDEEDDDEIEEDGPLGRTETDKLRAEADMPLDELLAQYGRPAEDGDGPSSSKDTSDENGPSSSVSRVKDLKGGGKGKYSSPALRAKGSSRTADIASSSQGTSSEAAQSSSSSSSSSASSSSASASHDTTDCVQQPSSSTSSNSVSNGHSAEGKTNVNGNASSTQNGKCEDGAVSVVKNSNNNIIGKSTGESSVAGGSSSAAADSSTSSSSTPSKASTKASPAGGTQSTPDSNGEAGGSGAGGAASNKNGESASSGGSGSGSGSSSTPPKKIKSAMEAMMDGTLSSDSEDDSDDDEDEEDWEDMSEEESDEDDDEDDEEENEDDGVPMMDMSNEEPGSDSGCTACVVMIQDKRVIVANAGDSRCVLGRAGKAVELSFDHKPEDDPERERIEKAGGKVTADGRVNGGLNLSRAIGDHVYKRNKELPAKDQMITALPDIETAELTGDDQFIVIACDGIWNYMTSQEVVEYVSEKLRDPEKRKKPSLVCEELFDHCLAPNTHGDGTGCDNMTCVIVLLNSFTGNPDSPLTRVSTSVTAAATSTESIIKDFKEADKADSSSASDESPAAQDKSSGALKRCADNTDVVSSSDEKRQKLEEEVA